MNPRKRIWGAVAVAVGLGIILVMLLLDPPDVQQPVVQEPVKPAGAPPTFEK